MARSRTSNKANALLTAPEACAFLGVKPQTLYAYVSRGQLTAEPDPDGRGNLYLRSDLEALRARSRARSGHGAVAAGALRWGEPVLESAITCIRGGRILYRGYELDALLARGTGFEAVAELLWSGTLAQEQRIWKDVKTQRPGNDAGESGNERLARRLCAAVTRLALADAEATDEPPDLALHRARAVIVAVASEVAGRRIDPARGIAPALAAALGSNSSSAVLSVERALVVSADHELNASTFAARVAASTGADLYGSLLAGLGAFSGRRHGLAPLDAHALLARCVETRRPGPAIDAILRRREPLPGFGHTLYPDGDPRTAPLLEAARLAPAPRVHDALDALLAAAHARGAPPPSLDLGLAAVAAVHGWPASAAAGLFAVGRVAGWTAHVLEQRQQGFMLRPRALYRGRA